MAISNSKFFSLRKGIGRKWDIGQQIVTLDPGQKRQTINVMAIFYDQSNNSSTSLKHEKF
jgi:hypothetical protein